jgi:RimJ/RimL family protein N-acetyltransferase
MAIPLPIVTPRLLVREADPDTDAAEMAEMYCDPDVMRFIPGGACADEAAVRALLAGYCQLQTTSGFSSWAVVEREGGRIVGDAGFAVFEPTGDIELGYTLSRRFWGLGYATEAAGACLITGLLHLGAPRIIAAVDAENLASLRVAGRIGMTRSEEMVARGRPHVIFSARAAEMEARTREGSDAPRSRPGRAR